MRRPFRRRDSSRLLAEREPVLLRALDLVLERRGWRPEDREAFQFRAVQSLLKHAAEHIPLYREKFQAAHFQPTHFATLDDLHRIPFLTKDDLRRADCSQLRTEKSRSQKTISEKEIHDARLLSSSGSTGIAGKLYRDEDSLAFFTAYGMVLYHDWCEGTPLTQGVYFLDIVPGSIDEALADWLRTTVPESRILSAADSVEEQIAQLHRWKAEFISSYPSTLRNMAVRLDREGRRFERAKLLHATSEMLDPRTMSLLRRVFPNAKIEQTYTSTEGGLMAQQCHEGRWHLCEEAALFEIVDERGQPTDELGELVVTNLMNWATPVIRYRGLGDLCRWDKTQCRCGSRARSIAQLEGRITESLAKPDGSLVTPFVLTNALEDVEGVYQFQIVQSAVDRIEVLVVADRKRDLSERELATTVQNIVRRLLSEETTCDVRFVERIPSRPGSHKTPLVVSNVARPEAVR